MDSGVPKGVIVKTIPNINGKYFAGSKVAQIIQDGELVIEVSHVVPNVELSAGERRKEKP
jgi:beta-lactam-binding protein with PASTA domain